MLLREERLLENFNTAGLFFCVECSIEVLEKLWDPFANYPFIFKKIDVGRGDIGPFMKQYDEKERLLSHPSRLLIPSFFLENGTINTPFLLFLSGSGACLQKEYRFVQNIPMKRFNIFVQSEVNARREGDESPNSSVVAATMKLLANSSYGYQIMDRSRHTVTKYLSDESTHVAISNKMFERLG